MKRTNINLREHQHKALAELSQKNRGHSQRADSPGDWWVPKKEAV